MTTTGPSILLVEDQPLTLLGMKLSLQEINRFQVVGEAENGLDAVREAKRLRPDVILMDISLPEMDGIEAAWKIKQEQPRTRIIMFTSHNTSDVVAAALGAGADAYCLKSRPAEEIAMVIDHIMKGNAWIDPNVADTVVRNNGSDDATSKVKLEPFEMQVLDLLRDGVSTREIASRLNATEDAVSAVIRGIIQAFATREMGTQSTQRSVEEPDVPILVEPIEVLENPSNLDQSELFAEKYAIEETLGRGGMGIVYKAQHVYMLRHVALKVLHPFLLADQKAIREFQQEAMSIACLDHPGIIRIHDFGLSAQREPYIVMELCEGTTLEEVMKKEERLDLNRFKSLFVQVCDALKAAHSAGIVHCDLKPSNFLINVDAEGNEVVKLVDFGVAKILNRDLEERAQNGGPVLVSGTPCYMSPEQCSARPLDARSDIYALGCVMFEALTGQKAFFGGNITEIFAKHFSYVPPSISTVIPVLFPMELDDCIAKMMEKDREHRVQTISEVRDVIASIGNPSL